MSGKKSDWKTEPPVKSGMYWLWWRGLPEPGLVRVEHSAYIPGRMMIHFKHRKASMEQFAQELNESGVTAWWHGPINLLPPELPKCTENEKTS